MENQVTEWQESQSFDLQTLSKEPSIRTLKNDEPIKEELRYIFAIIGLKNIPSKDRPSANMPSEYEVLLDYILKTYADLATGELRAAFLLATQGKFVVDEKHGVKHFESFSCEYLSRVMNKYREFRERELMRTKATDRPAQYKSMDDYLEQELFLKYQKMRLGEDVKFSEVTAWRLFNYLHNNDFLILTNAPEWKWKAASQLKEERQLNSVIHKYSVDYRARVLFFRNWIQEQAFNEINLRELLTKKQTK